MSTAPWSSRETRAIERVDQGALRRATLDDRLGRRDGHRNVDDPWHPAQRALDLARAPAAGDAIHLKGDLSLVRPGA